MTFSFAACGVPKPDTDLCVHNLPGLMMTCANLKKHYTDEGKLKKDLVWETYEYQTLAAFEKHMRETKNPQFVYFKNKDDMLEALNKRTSTDPTGLGNLKGYTRKMREFCQ